MARVRASDAVRTRSWLTRNGRPVSEGGPELDLTARLAGSDPGVEPWRVDWASGTDLDPRLRLKLHVGSVMAMAWGVWGDRPLIAVCTREEDDRGGGTTYRLRIWDVLSGRSRDLPCAEPVWCLSFALMDDDPVLLSGHREGRLRIWSVAGSSLRRVVDTGDDQVDELYVAESGQRAQVVTRNMEGRLQRWSLPDGEPLGSLDGPLALSMSGARLADGAHVLLAGGDGLSLWDLDGGRRLPLRVPPALRQVRGVVLAPVAGRDCMTLVAEDRSVVTFDLASGMQTSTPVTAHILRRPDGVMEMSSNPGPIARLTAVSGTIAVPTPWRVHLWDLGTSRQEQPPITGPVGRSLVQTVWWQDRELLLTGSAHHGVVALWDLEIPVVRPPGHAAPVSRVVLAEPTNTVLSADLGGTIVARDSTSGQPVTAPLATGIESTQALATWLDGRDVIAATGAGSWYVSDANLRQWNISTGEQHAPPIKAHYRHLHCMSRVRLPTGEALVTYGPGQMLKIWRLPDVALAAEVEIDVRSKVTGFATGVIDGRAWVAISSYTQPMMLYALDDLTAPPIVIPEAGSDRVLDLVGPHVVAARFNYEREMPKTLRVWDLSGRRVGPDIRSTAEITSAAGRAWPAVYVGRADGTVSLTDVETGRDLCHPMLLPDRPHDLTVTGDGGLLVAFGSDVARVHPPID